MRFLKAFLISPTWLDLATQIKLPVIEVNDYNNENFNRSRKGQIHPRRFERFLVVRCTFKGVQLHKRQLRELGVDVSRYGNVMLVLRQIVCTYIY